MTPEVALKFGREIQDVAEERCCGVNANRPAARSGGVEFSLHAHEFIATVARTSGNSMIELLEAVASEGPTMHRLSTFITAKKSSWLVLVFALAVSAAIFALGSGSTGESSPGVGLPDAAESSRVAALQAELPGADATSALFV